MLQEKCHLHCSRKCSGRMACPHHRKLHILVLEMWNFNMKKLRPIPYYPAPGNFQISYMFPVLRNATQYMVFQINVLHHSFRWKFHYFCCAGPYTPGQYPHTVLQPQGESHPTWDGAPGLPYPLPVYLTPLPNVTPG